MIPKSLHTITALANVARMLIETKPMHYAGAAHAPRAAVIDAAIILGYANHSDDYGLIDKAAATIAKVAPRSNAPLAALRHHVTGAINRGEAVAITEQRA